MAWAWPETRALYILIAHHIADKYNFVIEQIK